MLEAYDRLQPDWEMEAHLVKLKETWEACQVDLSKNAGKTQARINLDIEVREPKAGFGGLFDGMQ